MNKGKLIVIDGLDGAGKKTQLSLLANYCQEKNISCQLFDFPQYQETFFGALVARYLKGEFGDLKQTNPYFSSLPYAGDRWQAKNKILHALGQGKLVLVNRYVSSNLAFHSAKLRNLADQEKFINWVLELEYQIFGIPREELVIYLSVPADLGQKMVLGKGKRQYLDNNQKLDVHETDLVYLQKVGQVYERLAKRFSHWVEVDCLNRAGRRKSRETIHQEILKLLKAEKILY